MSAASYIGRIGGLAVALGVGTAIITGQGVANATPSADGQDSQTGSQSGDQTGDNTARVKDGDTGELGKIEVKPSRIAHFIGRHRATDTTANSVTATSIVKRLSDAVEAMTSKGFLDAMQNAAGAVDGDKTSVRTTSRSGGTSSPSDRRTARAERFAERTPTPDSPATDDVSTTNVVANEFVKRSPIIREWLASPRVAAGRAVEPTPPVSSVTPLWTPPRVLDSLRTVVMTAAPTTSPATTRSAPTFFGAVLDNVFSPFAGNAPTSPSPDSPLSWALLGASRRQIGVDSLASQSIANPASSLAYAPVPTMVNGVITYTNPSAPTGVTYTVVKNPSGGGKVLLDPTTGSFSFLPDLSSVQQGKSEEFSVLVAQTTPFTTAITQIPILGSLAPQIIVALQQIPIVNVVLAPLIGRSTVVPVTVDVGELAPAGTPVAFTVMVPSPLDGALISTNYFPATTVVNGAESAPTILNGPGLATAGNTDPNSVSIVDGIVPGLKPLRDAGYNVVTWDPRGEFASGGTLQLDSPDFEGQDVKGIISWVVANAQYTHPAFDSGLANPAAVAYDPAIGMVGGSYGGGIQLVSAYVDPRVDVIVPGITWNNLNDSLYPRQSFKTAYSSLLLLGLVTTGSRINPEIYAGIITGALLGVLTPSQQDLLKRSGSWNFSSQITVPTLFVQGTVDVLFPLQQALNNAATLGTPAEDVKMIWFCGGHGVCLTMNPTQLQLQTAFLIDNSIDWLDNTLMNPTNAPSTIPKFQFVDQNSVWYTAGLLPIDDENPLVHDFYFGSTPITTTGGAGGVLKIVPVVGGSGPQSLVPLPYSLGLGAPATNAINVPLNNPTEKTYVVGAPTLKFTYSGVGTSRHVFAQIVDKKTTLVVGNLVTPIPVTLDGTTHEAEFTMENIAYTMDEDSELVLQIVGSATAYENFTSYGVIDVSGVSVSLPTPGIYADVEEQNIAVPVAV